MINLISALIVSDQGNSKISRIIWAKTHQVEQMFRPDAKASSIHTIFAMCELIFHATVRNIRKSHGNAIIGLLTSIFQSVIGIAIMLLMMDLMGTNRAPVRGDRVLYIMSGIFSFMTHTRAIKSVSGAEGPTSSMMKHAPMNTIVSITSSALSALYMQTLSAAVILYGYHVLWKPISIDEPVGVLMMYLLAWISGCAIGLIFKALVPWAPDFFGLLTTVYSRANMVFSGKFFVANVTPMHILIFFTWNPLFHVIDQTRGFMFLNYTPHYSSIQYPLIVTSVLLVIGLIGERYTARHASVSWTARR